MRILLALSLLVALSISLVACGDSDDSDGDDEPTTEQPAGNGDDVPSGSNLDMPTDDGPPPTDVEGTVTDSGLTIIDLVVGDGDEVPTEASVTVHYSGWLEDGTIFDSSVQRGEPITFPLDGVITGWQEGIPGMKEGGTRRLIIPPELAYGEGGTGGIPPNSTLVFDVELISIE